MNEGVIATFFLDWGLSFGTGVLFGLAGRNERAHNALSSRAFRFGLVYLNVGVLGIAVALFALRPDWMWMYWIDARALPVGIIVLAFALYEIAYIGGFALVQGLERARRGSGWALAVATGALITAGELTARTRLFHVGSRAQFQAGRAPLAISISPLHVQPIAWLMLGAVLVSCVLAFALAMIVARANRAKSPDRR